MTNEPGIADDAAAKRLILKTAAALLAERLWQDDPAAAQAAVDDVIGDLTRERAGLAEAVAEGRAALRRAGVDA